MGLFGDAWNKVKNVGKAAVGYDNHGNWDVRNLNPLNITGAIIGSDKLQGAGAKIGSAIAGLVTGGLSNGLNVGSIGSGLTNSITGGNTPTLDIQSSGAALFNLLNNATGGNLPGIPLIKTTDNKKDIVPGDYQIPGGFPPPPVGSSDNKDEFKVNKVYLWIGGGLLLLVLLKDKIKKFLR
jgi:hypothetical protein